MSLKKFVEQENRINAMFYPGRHNPLDVRNLTAGEKKDLAQRLLGALSPENLSCDGELRGAKLQAKARMLYQAKADLEAMGQRVEWDYAF